MNKKTLCACLAAIMLASSSAMTVTAENTDTYKNDFTDISSSDWFYSDVVDAYSLGLINGKTADTFAPDKNLTIAETIKLAASVHQLLTTGKILPYISESFDGEGLVPDYIVESGSTGASFAEDTQFLYAVSMLDTAEVQ